MNVLRFLTISYFALLVISPVHGLEQAPPAERNWIERLRPTHPRVFLNSEMLPQVRQRVEKECAAEFEKLRAEVDSLPPDAPMIFTPDPVARNPDGSLKVKPEQEGRTLVKYNGGSQAAACAFVYLITGDEKYAEKAKNYLQLAIKVFQWTAEGQVRVDLMGNTRISALAAYDWIQPTLNLDERKAILVPILDYIEKAQPNGSYKFRRSFGGPEDGNYGEPALMYFAGLAGYGDGIDDARCADFLRRGGESFLAMMDYREKTSGGSGVLSTLTAGYSFGAYPYATFLFLHSQKAAFDADLSSRWTQMADYPKWFDFAAIRLGPEEDFLEFGIGDTFHYDNAFHCEPWMYAHLSQTIHFYGKRFPEKARDAYALLAELPARYRLFTSPYPFLQFLLSDFHPSLVVGAKASDEPGYFYTANHGLLIARSGRGPRDTYACFRCGSSLGGGHQHYDELSFVIYKGGFLALDSGSRTQTDHHHHYAAQSVAHNTLLIHDDNEPMPYFWTAWSYVPDGKVYFNHGGQNNKTAAKMIALRHTDDYVYAACDATGSYAGTKSREVVRQFVYIRPDYFIVYDRVASVKPEQRKEFLLHFEEQPKKIGDQQFCADNVGRLFVATLLPERAAIRFVGGPEKEFWASGRNWELDGGSTWDQKYHVTGKWRMEVSPPDTTATCRFLHFLQAAAPGTAAAVPTEYLKGSAEDGVRFTDGMGKVWEVWFNRSGTVDCRVEQVTQRGGRS